MTGGESGIKGIRSGQKNGLFFDVPDVSESGEEVVGGASSSEIKLDFKRVFRLAPGGMAIFGLDGRPVVVNGALAELLNCGDAGIYAKSLEDITHPEEILESRERVVRLLAREIATVRFQGRFVRDGGAGFRGVADLTLVRDDDAEPSYFVLSLRDDTERHEAERRLRESEERFRALVDKSSEIVKLVNLDGELRYASPAMERILGYPPEEIIGRNIFDFVHPEDIPSIMEATSEAVAADGEGQETIWNIAEYRMLHADGRWLNIESIGTYLLDHPAINGVVVNARDVTGRREAEDRIRRSEEKYRRVVETVGEVIFRTDEAGRWSFLNPAWSKLTGFTTEETLGRNVSDFVEFSGGDSTQRTSNEVSISTRRGTKRIFEVSFADGSQEGGGFEDSFGILHDVTERKRLENRLERLAMHDPLTDLPNRRLFLDHLRDSPPWSNPEGEGCVALLFVDLDRFKNINDTLGHEAGDSVLVAVAGRLRGCVRAEDFVARLGGEEFVVLMSGAGEKEAERAAERVLEVFERPFSLGNDGRSTRLTASIGISWVSSPEVRPEELLREADQAMYLAKNRGGGGWAVYERD